MTLSEDSASDPRRRRRKSTRRSTPTGMVLGLNPDDVPSPLLATQTASAPMLRRDRGRRRSAIRLDVSALDVDPADRVVGRVGDPDDVGAGSRSRRARPPISIGSPSRAWIDGSTRVTRVGAAVGDPDQAAADGDPGGAAADRDRRARSPLPRSMRRTAPVEALLTQTAAGADGEAQRRRVGHDAALEDPPAGGVDRRRFRRPRRRRPRPGRRRRRSRRGGRRRRSSPITSPRSGSTRRTSPAPRARHPDRAGADRAPRRRRGRAAAGCRRDSPLAGSIRESVPSGALVTQIASSPAARRSGAVADRDRRRDRGAPPSPSKNRGERRSRRPADGDRTLHQPRYTSGVASRPGAQLALADRRAVQAQRRPIGASESTRVAAGVAPLALAGRLDQLAGGRVAVGRVLRRRPVRSRRVEALRHLRLRCRRSLRA